MELALYCPDCGFYEKESDTVGRQGHFYTSVSVGRLFGELLAFQFAHWLDNLNVPPRTLSLVEAGAHDGKLAHDVLSWFKRRRPALLKQIEYSIIEPSARRRATQQERLKDFAPRVRWLDSGLATFSSRFTGIVFSNELLDAMPVHRFGWDALRRKWFEWGVAVDGEQFVWARMPQTPLTFHSSLPTSSGLLDVLPDGYTIEISPAATQWWREAASALACGKLLTLDYGFTHDEWLSPARPHGTLRAYQRHRVADNVIADAGEQDITAHVNFTEIQNAGEAVGLRTETLQTQGKFLTEIAARAWSSESGFGEWQPEQSRQFQTLTHPDHLGRSFRVLIQSR